MSNQTPAVVPKTIKSQLASDYFRQQIALLLPKHMTAERFTRIALTALTRTPKLQQCTWESVLKCMMTCSELGLEPDGRRFHLIPFENRKRGVMECQGIIDYKGLVELVRNNGEVSSIHADVVCDKDEFSYVNGEVTHGVNFRTERGPMFAAYVTIVFKDGSRHTEVMTRAEVDAIRKRSRAANDGPWMTDYNEMAKKTVFRRATKWITLSPEVQDAIDRDADAPVGLVAEPQVKATPAGDVDDVVYDEAAQDVQIVNTTDGGTVEVVPEKKSESKKEAPKQVDQSKENIHTVQQSLAEIVEGGGFTFDDFRKWATETGNLTDADSLTEWSEIPTAVCKRMITAKAGLLKGLDALKKGTAI